MRHRTEILVILLGAFNGLVGDLSEAEVNYGMAVIERDYGCDLDAVAADLRAERAALALACSVQEKRS